MGGSSSQTIGYSYLMGMHMGVCRGPVDALVEIRVADRTAWAGNVTSSQTVQIDAEELFGGNSAEGGIVGPLDVMMGESTQPVNPRLASMLGGLVPAFRGKLTLFFDGLVSSMNPYPKPWSMRVRRITAGWEGDNPWQPGSALIELAGGQIHAMNPIHIIYQALTDPDWGLGNARQMIGTSFDTAAALVRDEGFGLCLRWNRQTSVEQFTQEIVQHVGGNVYLDHFTGRWEINLVRDDYDPEALPVFDYDSGLVEVEEDGVSASAEAVNEIIVTYRDPISNEDRQVRVQNLAAIQSAGAVRSQTLNFPGIPTADLAYRVAQRELRARSTGVKRYKLLFDRRGYQLQPGSVFRLSVPTRGIQNSILRVGQVRNSELRQGPIEIDAAQDVFGLPQASYVTAQPPGYTPPQITPMPIEVYRVVELTYRDALGLDDLPAVQAGGTGAWLCALAVRNNPLSRNFLLQTRPEGAEDWTSGRDGDYCAGALIVDEITLGVQPVNVSLTSAVDLDLVTPGTAALVDDEIMRVDAIDAEALTATLARGCVDTVPAVHAAGSRIWFYGGGYAAVDPTEYEAGETVDGRLRSRTSIATLPASEATGDAISVTGRPGRPYPPGRVRVNNVVYPDSATGILTIDWAARDREVINDQLVDAAMPPVGNPDVTYIVRLVREDTNEELANSGHLTDPPAYLSSGYSGEVRLTIETYSVGTLRRSHQMVVVPFIYIATGYGRAWGYNWGGTLSAGAIAPRGEVGGRRLDIMPMAYLNGRYVGNWVDPDNLNLTFQLVSSEDAVNWVVHNAPFRPSSLGQFLLFDGGYIYRRYGEFWISPSLDGPWERLDRPDTGSEFLGSTPAARALVVDGELIIYWQSIHGTHDGENWQTYSMPPLLDEDKVVVSAMWLVHGSNGYIMAVKEGDLYLTGTADPNNEVRRLWHSTDLINWTLVTPAPLQDGDWQVFESGTWSVGRWTGVPHFQGGRYFLLVRKSATSLAGDRTLFHSPDGMSWSEATFNEPPGNGLAPIHMGYVNGTHIVILPSINWTGWGVPKSLTSINGQSWTVTSYNPANNEYLPVRLFSSVSGPDGFFVGDGDPNRQGTGLIIRGQLVKTTDGINWEPQILPAPTPAEE